MSTTYFRSAIIHCLDDPQKNPDNAIAYFEDGLLIVEDGKVIEVGDFKALKNNIVDTKALTHYPHHLLMPGLIDTHVHFPQTEIIAAYGEQLLGWLNTYTFPTETKFSDKAYCQKISQFFLNQLFQNGTTSALVFGTVHPQSVDAFFTEAEKYHCRMIAGKVMMDRNCPDNLQDTAETGYTESLELIKKWHNKGRLSYAVTPRFAPTSSPLQLKKASELLKLYPDLYLHTHLAENQAECDWVRSLFPHSEDYLAVYEQYGLLKKRSVMAHGIHLTDNAFQRLAKQQTAIAHCPSSNLFMGSGLFNLKQCEQHGVPVGLGTDVGAGTSFSLLDTFADAYKVQQLQGHKLSAFKGLYLNTLGGARALDLEDKIGNFQQGKEADFILLDLNSSELLKLRLQHAKDLHDKLFALMLLANTQTVAATYILGKPVFKQL